MLPESPSRASLEGVHIRVASGLAHTWSPGSGFLGHLLAGEWVLGCQSVSDCRLPRGRQSEPLTAFHSYVSASTEQGPHSKFSAGGGCRAGIFRVPAAKGRSRTRPRLSVGKGRRCV